MRLSDSKHSPAAGTRESAVLRQFFVRDRMVMTGLVVLGFLTVAAGFMSGRSTFRYALSTDARLAAAGWVETVEREILWTEDGVPAAIGGRQIRVIAPDVLRGFRNAASEPWSTPARIGRSAHDESGLLRIIDKFFSGWLQSLTRLLDSDGHVSQIERFAIVDSRGRPILRSETMQPAALGNILARARVRAELHKALGLFTTRSIDNFARPGRPQSEFHKLLLMPVIEGPSVTRVYVLEVDQSSAATMSKVALVAASMVTSLLIVLGYSIPTVIAFRRIRERWETEDRIRFLALHDPLTGLPNRVQMQNRLQQALARVKRKQSLLAVMCLDLDRFKDVNDTLGHQAGDALLKDAAERLRDCVRETDIVARLGGDEFTVIAEDLDSVNDAIPIARRICEALATPFKLKGHTLVTSGSLGITFAPAEGSTPDVLLNNADLALYRAKHEGRNTYRFFEAEMDRAVQERRRLAKDLGRALRDGDVQVAYQPQYDLRTNQLTGYEALARWTHPEDGEIPPAEFIPIAEESGLIGRLGEQVLMTACRYALCWPDDVTLSVNISPAQFRAQDMTALVARVLHETRLPAHRLHLEITENLLLNNTAETIEILKALTALGVSLALDDFGTGCSSLAYLARFPVRKIKIDRSFVAKMESDTEMRAIVSTIVGLGRSLDVTITAEGVETEHQAAYLRRLGCTEVQGYLFGRAEPTVEPARQGSAPVRAIRTRKDAAAAAQEESDARADGRNVVYIS